MMLMKFRFVMVESAVIPDLRFNVSLANRPTRMGDRECGKGPRGEAIWAGKLSDWR